METPKIRLLGRRAIKTDSRTLRLARYLTPGLPSPPVSCDWTKGITDWGMMLNDKLGCCTIAGAAHAIQVWSANAGGEQTVTDADVQAMYTAWDGYNPADPNSDQGGIELDVLSKWRKQGFNGHQILAFADPFVRNLNEVRQAINLFGGLYIGVELPLTAEDQDELWDAVQASGAGAAGSWGGHCVYVVGYDASGFTFISWGKVMKMTLAFWNAYVDEAHALLSPDWLAANTAPNGFNLDQLQADLSLIH